MEAKQPTPSVIARLMGLDERLPPPQPVCKPQRVLSENYLQKSASICLLEKRSSRKRRFPNVYHERGQRIVNAIEVHESPTMYRNSIGSIHWEKGNSRMGKGDASHSPPRIVTLKPNLCKEKKAAKPPFSSISKEGAHVKNVEVPNQVIEMKKITKDERTSRHGYRECSEFARGTSRQKIQTISNTFTKMSRKKLRVDDSFNNKAEVVTYSCPLNMPFSAKQANKQFWEHSKTIKGLEEFGVTRRNTNTQEDCVVLEKLENITGKANPDKESSENSSLFSSIHPCADLEYEQTVLDSMIIQDELKKSSGKNDFSRTSAENDEFSDNSQEKHFDPTANVLIAVDEQHSHISDALTRQESSDSLSFPEIDPEFYTGFGECYSPSPNSVLDPLFNEETSSGSERFEGHGADLNGLQMQLQLLKSEAEETNSVGPGMVVSSDEGSEDESVDHVDKNREFMGLFRAEESRDSSYIVEVLDEARFLGNDMKLNFQSWNSLDFQVNPLVFEMLEKKYNKQSSWDRSKRRLLFDCMNLGLKEILYPCMGVLTLAKPLRKSFNLSWSREAIEDELWRFLVSQEKEVNKCLSEKAMGKETRWLELGDDIDLIVCEIEKYLFDELVAELLNIESF